MPILLPKTIVPVEPTKDAPLFFLAGPIRGGGDWQCFMSESILRKNIQAQIACPSRWTRTHPLSHFFVKPFSEAANRQLHWERHYMEQAGLGTEKHGCLIFWLGLENKHSPHPGPEPYAMDTRREIGKWTAFMGLLPVNVVVGGHPDFHGLSVILDELENASGKSFPFHLSVEAVVDAAFARVAG